MNIAFQAVFLLIILLPGLLLRYTYNGRLSKELVLPQNYTPFSRDLVWIFLISMLCHALWIWVSNWWVKPIYVDLSMVLFLLAGDYSDSKELLRATQVISDFRWYIFSYFALIIIIASAIGFFLHRVIRLCRLDRKFKFFRFNNEWHYLLTGEVLDFPDTGQTAKEVDVVSISAVINICNVPYVYVGFVRDYHLDNRGNLDYILLERAFRRKLKNDRDRNKPAAPAIEDDDRYYKIDGNYFVLDCTTTKNLNIKYISLTPASTPQPIASAAP